MAVIKNRTIKAYILLESLVTLSIFAMITSLLLFTVVQTRKQHALDTHQQEVLNLAKMAVQTRQSHLELNGISLTVHRTKQEVIVYHGKEIVVHVEQD